MSHPAIARCYGCGFTATVFTRDPMPGGGGALLCDRCAHNRTELPVTRDAMAEWTLASASAARDEDFASAPFGPIERAVARVWREWTSTRPSAREERR